MGRILGVLTMVRDAEGTARAAEADDFNTPGYCLQQCRIWADIPSLYGTAAVAWSHASRRQYNRFAPRGAFVFWTGGSRGYGHIAVALGGGYVRSTDAGGTGRVATRHLDWFDANWPSQNFGGWTDNVNGVTVPGVVRDGFDMADEADLRRVVREELNNPDFIAKVAHESQQAVWGRRMNVTNAEGNTALKSTAELVKNTWETTRKILRS